MKAGIELCTSSFSVVILPVLFALLRSFSRSMHSALDGWVPYHFASDEEMFPWVRKWTSFCGWQSWNLARDFYASL